jgi:hypothetical protein
MNQRQLLLVILVTILIGLATVFAINTFDNNELLENRDAVRVELVTMAAKVQDWYAKPVELGGSGGDYTGSLTSEVPGPLNFHRIGYFGTDSSDTDVRIHMLQAVYTINVVSPDSVVIYALPSSNQLPGEHHPIRLEAIITDKNITINEVDITDNDS